MTTAYARRPASTSLGHREVSSKGPHFDYTQGLHSGSFGGRARPPNEAEVGLSFLTHTHCVYALHFNGGCRKVSTLCRSK
jgi:hypothetical protein